MPVAVQGQASAARRNEVVWHWFGDCAGKDSLSLDITLDGRAIFTANFPICQRRRGDIKPERQQRILEFRFDAVPRRFGWRSRTTVIHAIEGDIWEAGGDANSIEMGVSLAAEGQVLANMTHVARPRTTARSEWVRGFVLTTRPVAKPGPAPPK